MADPPKIQRLVDAGLIHPDALDPDDRTLIQQLSDDEITVLIGVATRLYPDAPSMVKVDDLRRPRGPRRIRICVPL